MKEFLRLGLFLACTLFTLTGFSAGFNPTPFMRDLNNTNTSAAGLRSAIGAMDKTNAQFFGIATNLVATGGIVDTNAGTGAYTLIRSGWFYETNSAGGVVLITNGNISLSGNYLGNGINLTNIAASNIVSGGVIPNGTLATNALEGGFLIQTGDKRRYTLDGGALTNLQSLTINTNQIGPITIYGNFAKTNGSYIDGNGEIFSNAVGYVVIAGGKVSASVQVTANQIFSTNNITAGGIFALTNGTEALRMFDSGTNFVVQSISTNGLFTVTHGYGSTSNTMRMFNSGNNQVFTVTTNGEVYVGTNNQVKVTWDTNIVLGGNTAIVVGVPNTTELRNGSSQQILKLDNTYTDSGNYERFSFGRNGSDYYFRTEYAGSGSTARNLLIGADGSGALSFVSGGQTRFTINSSGHLLAGTDNTYDIGDATHRPRTLTLGTSLVNNGTSAFGSSGQATIDGLGAASFTSVVGGFVQSAAGQFFRNVGSFRLYGASPGLILRDDGASNYSSLTASNVNASSYVFSTNGFASYKNNTAANTSITVGASPFNYTNTTGVNIFVDIDANGGTTTVGRNGTTVFTALINGDHEMHLKPGGYLTVTYSVATPIMGYTED